MTHEHTTKEKPKIKVIIVSDSRTLKEDKSGQKIKEILKEKAKEIDLTLVKDDKAEITQEINTNYDLIIYSGGTGVSKKDVTIEAIKPLLEKQLPGFGEYFRKKSSKEIGARTILTRTTAGLYQNTYLFAVPGSTNAAETASKIIKDQINHLMYHKKE